MIDESCVSCLRVCLGHFAWSNNCIHVCHVKIEDHFWIEFTIDLFKCIHLLDAR